MSTKLIRVPVAVPLHVIQEAVDAFSAPDWHSGYEFGKPRNEVSPQETKKISPSVQKKIDAVTKLEAKVLAKMKADRFAMFTVKRGPMRSIEKVDGRTALSILSQKKSAISSGRFAAGIVWA